MDFTSKEFLSIREKFKKGHEKKKSSVAYYGAVYPSGDELSLSISAADYCHAGLNSFRSGAVVLIDGIQKVARKDREDGEDYEGMPQELPEEQGVFTKWLINDSPWSHVYLNDYEDVNKWGHYLMDTTVDASFVASACIAARLVSEWPLKGKMFKYLMDHGWDGRDAFLVAQHYHFDGEKAYHHHSYGHVALDSGFGPEVVKNFRAGTPKLKGTPFSTSPRYGGISSMWGGSSDSLKNKVLKIRPKVVKKTINHDIFWQPSDRETTYFSAGEQLLTAAQQTIAIFKGA